MKDQPVAVPDRTVWIDGRLLCGGDAVVPFFDRGAHDGEGLFETLRVYQGRGFAWKRHLERLVVSAAELGFPVAPDPRLLKRALDEVLEANRLTDAAARITMTRGVPGGRPVRPGVWIEVEPLAARLWEGARTQSARVMISKRLFAPGSLGRHKTLSRLPYHLAREEARAARADEALLADASGQVLEGSVSNVFAVIAGRLVTPPLSLGILPGIARAIVLECARARDLAAEERSIPVAELRGADEILLTNSIQEVVPVAQLEGRALPGRALGLELATDYRRRVDAELGEG